MRTRLVALGAAVLVMAGCGTTSPDPEPAATETTPAAPTEGQVRAAQAAVIAEWWADQSTDDQDALCQYWAGVPGAVEEAAARLPDHDIPVSEAVFVDWVEATCV